MYNEKNTVTTEHAQKIQVSTIGDTVLAKQPKQDKCSTPLGPQFT